ncbi:hypothetical protein BC826DRAFT_228592 [Russula brevipes]|nr:hypothetical protein BC826DRAFT_228592 [Russula brevipes]
MLWGPRLPKSLRISIDKTVGVSPTLPFECMGPRCQVSSVVSSCGHGGAVATRWGLSCCAARGEIFRKISKIITFLAPPPRPMTNDRRGFVLSTSHYGVSHRPMGGKVQQATGQTPMEKRLQSKPFMTDRSLRSYFRIRTVDDIIFLKGYRINRFFGLT